MGVEALLLPIIGIVSPLYDCCCGFLVRSTIDNVVRKIPIQGQQSTSCTNRPAVSLPLQSS